MSTTNGGMHTTFNKNFMMTVAAQGYHQYSSFQSLVNYISLDVAPTSIQTAGIDNACNAQYRFPGIVAIYSVIVASTTVTRARRSLARIGKSQNQIEIILT